MIQRSRNRRRGKARRKDSGRAAAAVYTGTKDLITPLAKKKEIGKEDKLTILPPLPKH